MSFKLPKWVLYIPLLAVIYVVSMYSSPATRAFITSEKNSFDFYQSYLKFFDKTAPNPWQYRILGPHLIKAMQELGVEFPKSFYRLSFFITAVLLLSLLVYFNKLKFTIKQQCILLSLYIFAHLQSSYDCCFFLDTHINTVLMILGMLAIMVESWVMLPLILVGVFNRETILIIPVIALLYHWKWSKAKIPLVSLVFGLLTYWLIHIWRGPAVDFNPYNTHIGLGLLWFNIIKPSSYVYITFTYALLPLVALMNWKNLTPQFKRIFWALPLWIGIHLLLAVVGETRLFLAPYAIIILPALINGDKNISTFRPPQDGSVLGSR